MSTFLQTDSLNLYDTLILNSFDNLLQIGKNAARKKFWW